MIYPRETKNVGSCIKAVPKRTGKVKRCNFIEPEFKGRYTRTGYMGNEWYSHRLSYHLNKGSIPRCPDNLKVGLVLHTCDHKWCINPDHLYLGDSSQNTQDMLARNQNWWRNSRNNFAKGWVGMSEERRQEVFEKRNKAIRAYHQDKKKIA